MTSIFLSGIAIESLLYRNKWNSEEKLTAFSVPAIKNFCKENVLPSRVSQSDVNEMVRAAAEEV